MVAHVVRPALRSFAIALPVLAVLICLPCIARGQLAGEKAEGTAGEKVGEKAADKPASNLPLGKVVLFSSGVGFFEHSGEVQGDAHVEFKFNIEDINDLLKSIVIVNAAWLQLNFVLPGW